MCYNIANFIDKIKNGHWTFDIEVQVCFDYDNFALFNGPILPIKQGINILEDWRTTWYV